MRASITALLFCVVLAALFFCLLRLKKNKTAFLILGLLPIGSALLLLPYFRIYGNHGWVQAGMVYNILAGNIPPLQPLLSDQPALYPWGYPFLLAVVCKLVAISPFYASAGLSILSLACLLILTYKIARLFSNDNSACFFSVLISLYALTFTQSIFFNPFQDMLQKVFHLALSEGRAVPIIEKFSGCTGFHLGMTSYSLFLYCLLKLFAEPEKKAKLLAGLFFSFLGIGFFYPFLLPGVIAGCILIYIYNLFFAGPVSSVKYSIPILLFCACLCLIPYLYPLATYKHGGSVIKPTLSIHTIIANCALVFVTIAPVLLVILFSYKNVVRLFKDNKTALVSFGILIVFNLILYVSVNAPLETQYKFMALANYGLGIIGGLCFFHIYQRSKILCFVLSTVFLFPTGAELTGIVNNWKNVPERCREQGVLLVHENQADENLYRWIRANTPGNAVFIDSKLTVPVFAQRMLFIGYDSDKRVKGYGMSARTILAEVNNYDPELLENRWRTEKDLLSENAAIDRNIILQLDKLSGNSDVYLIARSPAQRDKFNSSGSFQLVFENTEFTVFKFNRGSIRG